MQFLYPVLNSVHVKVVFQGRGGEREVKATGSVDGDGGRGTK